MTGRCAGCGLTNKNADLVREHTRYCMPFRSLYLEYPEAALDPGDEYIRWREAERGEERQEHKDAAVSEADRRRAVQQARWKTPPDILED